MFSKDVVLRSFSLQRSRPRAHTVTAVCFGWGNGWCRAGHAAGGYGHRLAVEPVETTSDTNANDNLSLHLLHLGQRRGANLKMSHSV